MRNLIFTYFCFIVTILAITGCSNNKLPEAYGYYACNGKSISPVASQKIGFAGNISWCITGIKGTSGTAVDSVTHFIVYEKDVNIKSLSIAQLHFKQSGSVQNLMGNTPVELNMWVVAEKIEFDVSPIENKKDMYKLTPKSPLKNGFYALHTGALNSTSTIEASSFNERGNPVYDVVIGEPIDKYKSADARKQEKDSTVNNEAKSLLNSYNSYFNAIDCEGIKEVYAPNGKPMAGKEMKDYCNGIREWQGKAGRITKSDFLKSEVNDDGGAFEISTTYEKTGLQQEKFVVKKIGGKFRIVAFE